MGFKRRQEWNIGTGGEEGGWRDDGELVQSVRERNTGNDKDKGTDPYDKGCPDAPRVG